VINNYKKEAFKLQALQSVVQWSTGCGGCTWRTDRSSVSRYWFL